MFASLTPCCFAVLLTVYCQKSSNLQIEIFKSGQIILPTNMNLASGSPSILPLFQALFGKKLFKQLVLISSALSQIFNTPLLHPTTTHCAWLSCCSNLSHRSASSKRCPTLWMMNWKIYFFPCLPLLQEQPFLRISTVWIETEILAWVNPPP